MNNNDIAYFGSFKESGTSTSNIVIIKSQFTCTDFYCNGLVTTDFLLQIIIEIDCHHYILQEAFNYINRCNLIFLYCKSLGSFIERFFPFSRFYVM